MSSTAPGSSQGLRIRRTRLALLALPGLVILLYVTGALDASGSVSQRVNQVKQGWTGHRAVSDSQWAAQEDQLRQCRVQWLETGAVCSDPPKRWGQQTQLDAVWLWSNASLKHTTQLDQSNAAAKNLLPYSLRSAQKHMRNGFGSAVILTPNVPNGGGGSPENQNNEQLCTHEYKDASGSTGHGQRPCWFDSSDRLYEPPGFLHHQEVACNNYFDMVRDHCSAPAIVGPAAPASTAQLLAGSAKALSTTRLVFLPHHIMMRDLHASDFWSALYGPVYRYSGNWQEDGQIPVAESNVTETKDGPTIRANALLNRRFGSGTRRRLLDLPQPLSSVIVKELAHTWPQHISLTGSISSSKSIDIVTLHAHYMAERYREALLWSFFVARHDRDGDGSYSAEERATLLTELGAPDVQKPVFPPVAFPIRTSNDRNKINANLERMRLPPMSEIKPLLTSMDGSAFYMPLSPAAAAQAQKAQPDQALAPICGLSGDCIAPLFQNTKNPSVAQVFQRMAQELPLCGQCVIFHLVQKSGLEGLSAFLPSPDLTMSPMEKLPLISSWQGSDFTLRRASGASQARRVDVVAGMLARYSHSLIYEDEIVAPAMLNRTQAVNELMLLDANQLSSLLSFRRHGTMKEQTPGEAFHWMDTHGFKKPLAKEDAAYWVKIVRAWLSTRFPYKARFEAKSPRL